MDKEFQNSAGFLKTKKVSNASLITNIQNFEFSSEEIQPFSDRLLEIPERLMLGKRAERYFSEWLKESVEYDLVAENIQIIHEKQTLGEFDFIIRRKADQQLVHVELVYKFYLFDPSVDGSEFEHWIGPNRGDQLDFKLDKLTNHQFPLFFHEASKEKFHELNIETENIEQQVLFLANLFVPLNEEVKFDRVNQQAMEGKWMRLADWELHSSKSHQFALPPKIDWFSRELNETQWFSKEEMREKIQAMHSRKRSPLIYSKDESGNQRRDFVVWW